MSPNPLLTEALGDAEGRAIILRLIGKIGPSPEKAGEILQKLGAWIKEEIQLIAELVDVPLSQRAPHIRRRVNDFLEEACRPEGAGRDELNAFDAMVDRINEEIRLDVLRDEALRQETPIDDYSEPTD